MVEARVDPETGDWNVIAPRRAQRPEEGRSAAAARCPFCYGNEAMTPPEVLRVPAGAAAWQVRVVPNLYAAVDTPDGNRVDPVPAPGADPSTALQAAAQPAAAQPAAAQPAAAQPAAQQQAATQPAVGPHTIGFSGRHEVVIESGRHDWDLRDASPDEAVTVLSAIRQRCRALAGRGPAATVVFRNYGVRAGASLSHPHSQIVSLDQRPPGLVRRWARAREHYRRTGTCLHDDLAAAQRRDPARLVLDTGGVLVFAPWSASVPHQTTLLSADRVADLANASDDALTAVAHALPRVLTGLAQTLNDPAYNLVVHAGPPDDPTAHDWYRWHITLYPRVTTTGGLEIATGVAVNPTAPEHTAPALRRAIEG